MPAKRRSKRKHKNLLKQTAVPLKKVLFSIFIILVLIVVVIIIKIQLSENLWTGNEKLSIAIDNKEDGVVVVLLDPKHNEMHKFYYPENLEIEAARNLGKWKIGSLWDLGENEKVGGSLLAQSITKSIRTPVYSWSNQQLLSILDKGLLAIPQNLINFNNSTNLSIKDFFRIFRFVTSIDKVNIVTYYAENLNYISSHTLRDGTDGYVVSRMPETRISSLFSDEYVLSQPNRAVIISSIGNNWKAKQIGEVFEVIGVKVAAIREEANEVKDCEISANDEKLAINLSRYFDCDYNTKTSTNFDVEIRIGQGFVNRF